MRPENRAFTAYVMADVYALLDFLSGRAKPSLTALPVTQPPDRRGLNHSQTQFSFAANWPSNDYAIPGHPMAYLEEAMRIGKKLEKPDGEISESEAAFLIQTRDGLNITAAPATGSSIIFTLLVIDAIYSLKAGLNMEQPSGPLYIYRDEWLEPAAMSLAKDVRKWLHWMFILLVVTITLSAYVAWGKLLSDTRDAVNRDHGANMLMLEAEASESRGQSPASVPATIELFCQSGSQSFAKSQNCNRDKELKERKRNVRNLLASWIIWPVIPLEERTAAFSETPADETIEQITATRIGVLGNYVLPLLYGVIGSLGFVLRRFNRQLAARLLTPRESRASAIRLMLGAVSGTCIGLFYNSSPGLAQVSGLGGAAVTLSASAIAFLAGYGVEAVFKTLDKLLTHIFDLDNGAQEKPNQLELHHHVPSR